MAKFNRLPLFTDAYLADTGHLTTLEHGAYLLLLMAAWRTPGCSLPDDDAALARWAKLRPQSWARIKPTIMALWTLAEGRWTQRRLNDVRKHAEEVAERNRVNGQKGGRPSMFHNILQIDDSGAHHRVASATLQEQVANALNGHEIQNPDGSVWVSQKNPSESESESEKKARAAGAASNEEVDLYRRGKFVLGANTGGLIKKLLAAKGKNVALARAVIETAATKQDPKEYVGGALRDRRREETRGDDWG